MAEIQEKIDYAYARLQQHADDTLKTISENYQNRLLAKIAEELELAKASTERGNDWEAGQHTIRGEVYKSALDAMRRRQE